VGKQRAAHATATQKAASDAEPQQPALSTSAFAFAFDVLAFVLVFAFILAPLAQEVEENRLWGDAEIKHDDLVMGAGHARRTASHCPPRMPAVDASYASRRCRPSNYGKRLVLRQGQVPFG
jgi:hypothetical protein